MNGIWGRLTRLPLKVARTQAAANDDDLLVLLWAREGLVKVNWGDKLNPVLARMISGKNVVHSFDIFRTQSQPVYYVIGSSLEHAQRTGGVVWGVGFIAADQGIPKAPRRIHAVRGYRSVERLRQLGVPCPEVVGDPALLLPRFYQPKQISRSYRVGIIPHCYEQDLSCVQSNSLPEGALLIDITAGIFDVIDQICACDEIISSSLHGLICAEAYGVPSQWIKLSDRPMGDGFKYHDYLSSIGKSVSGPIPVRVAADWLPLLEKSALPVARQQLDQLGKQLLDACPFRPGASH